MSDELDKNENTFRKILDDAHFEPDMEGVWNYVEAHLDGQKPKRRVALLWWGMGSLLMVLVAVATMYLVSGRSSEVQKHIAQKKLTVTSVEEETPATTRSAEILTHVTDMVDSVTSIRQMILASKNTSVDQQEQSANVSLVSFDTAGVMTALDQKYSAKEEALPSTNTAPQIASRLGEVSSPVETVLMLEQQNELYSSVEKVRSTASMPARLSVDPILLQLQMRDDLQITHIQPARASSARYFCTLRCGANTGYTRISNIQPAGEFDEAAFGREADRLGLSIGLDIGRSLESWRIFGGGSFSQVVARYSRLEEQLLSSTQPGTQYIFVDDDGNSSAVAGDVVVNKKVSYQQQWHRRHSMIDVHVGVGRDLLIFGDFSIGLDGVLGYNMSTAHSGYQFVEGEDPLQKLDASDQNKYRNKMGMSAAIMGRVSFQLQQVEIALVPVWRYQFSPFTNTNNFYQIESSQLGLQLGMTYMPRWK